MDKHQDKLRLTAIVLLCLLHAGFGLYAGQTPLLICGAAGMVYAAVAAAGSCRAAKPAAAEANVAWKS
jgi:hypothetical protein